MESTVTNLRLPLPAHLAGAKFRPCRWSNLFDRTVPDTWGLECKPKGQRRYWQVGWQMKVNPFTTEAEAKRVCFLLNAAAKNMAATVPSQEGAA